MFIVPRWQEWLALPCCLVVVALVVGTILLIVRKAQGRK
jgi:hypothetical protein